VYPENDPNEQPRQFWCWLYRAQQAFDATATLPRIAAPTLVLVGDEDHIRCNGIPSASLGGTMCCTTRSN
jgi:hypothetical protein